MPCNYLPGPDPWRWARCRAAVRAEMLASGWIERSAKFNEVLLRRTRRAYAQS